MHNGLVRIDDEKMSKSLGNFFTVRSVLERYPGEVVRYFLLASHYRSPLNYSTANLESARSGLERLYTAVRGLAVGAKMDQNGPWYGRFKAAMDDDFNTPEALAVLFALAREVNRARTEAPDEATGLAATLTGLAGILGLLRDDPESYFQNRGEEDMEAGEVQALVQAREQARARGDWAEADRIRDRLNAAGIVLEDGPDGTRWRRGFIDSDRP